MHKVWDLQNPKRKKSTLIILASSYIILAVNIIQNILFVPLYIEYFGVRLYGLWLATGGVAMMLSFFDLGIPSLMIQRTAREFSKKNYEGISRYFFTGVSLHFFLMMLLFFSGLVLHSNLGRIVTIRTEEIEVIKSAFLISIIATSVSLLNNGIEGVSNALQKPIFVKSTMIVGSIVGVVSIFVALTVFNKSIISIPLGILIGVSIPFAFNLIYLSTLFYKNNIPLGNWDRIALKDYLDLIPSVFFSKLGTSITNSIEPTLIARYITPEIAVFYSVSIKAASLIKTILNRFAGSVFPSFAHFFGEKDTSSTRTMFLKLTNGLIFISVIFYSYYLLFNESFVYYWVGNDNYLSNLLTLLLSISFFLSFFSNYSSYLLGATGDIKGPSQLIFVESIAKIIFLFLALKYIGIYGIPISIILISIMFLYVYMIRWKKLLNIEFVDITNQLKKKLSGLIIVMITAGIIFILGIDPSNKVNVIIWFCFYSVFIGIISYHNVEEARKFIKTTYNKTFLK